MHAQALRRWLPGVALLAALAVARAEPEAVILLHGLARSSSSMERLEAALEFEGYSVVNVDYASRTAPIAVLARDALQRGLSDPRVARAPRIHLVTHSLGGLLVRRYLKDQPLPRLGRVVMLGPPNGGSELVDVLGTWRIFGWINGPAGAELGTGEGSVPCGLGPVEFELGVIAGDRSINGINSLILPGMDDGKVTVERTRVAGMKDHVVVPVSHPFLMKDRTVIALTIRFLRHGRFGR